MDDTSLQDYLILLCDDRVLPIRLHAATVTMIAADQQEGILAGAYPAYTASDEAFTCMLRLADVVAITHAHLSMDNLDRTFTARELIRMFRGRA